MAKLTALDVDGRTHVIQGRRFSHYVANIQFWFLLHDSISDNGKDISEWKSAKKVASVTINDRIHARGDDIKAARATIDALVARYGAQRVRSVLEGA